MKSSLMTKGEFARHRGVRPSAVSNWAKAGHLVYAEGEGGKLFVDVQRTEARLNAKVDQTRGRPTSNEQAPPPIAAAQAEDSLGNVRTDLMRVQITGKQLDNARRAGDLVPLQEAERMAGEMGRMARERMHSIVRNMAEVLAAKREPREIVALLAGEIDRGFAELADQVEAGALDQAEDDDILDGADAPTETLAEA